MKEDKIISETIRLLRFPLTVFVVFIHYNMGVRGFSLHGVTYGLDAPEWFRWVTALFSDVLPRTAVPLFYIISGYLFFRGGSFDTDVYRRKLRTRASTLLVPYLLWNVIAVLVQLSHRLPFLSSVFPSAHLMEVQLTPLRLFRTFFDNYWNKGILITPENDGMVSELPYPTDVPLWYVRDLMVLVLLAPAIWWIVKRAGRWLVVVLGAEILRQHYSGTLGEAEEQRDQGADRRGYGSDRGEGLVGYVPSDDPDVHHVVELLEQIAQQERNGEAYEQL